MQKIVGDLGEARLWAVPEGAKWRGHYTHFIGKDLQAHWIATRTHKTREDAIAEARAEAAMLPLKTPRRSTARTRETTDRGFSESANAPTADVRRDRDTNSQPIPRKA